MMLNVSSLIKIFASTLLVAALIAAFDSNSEHASAGLKGSSRKLQFISFGVGSERRRPPPPPKPASPATIQGNSATLLTGLNSPKPENVISNAVATSLGITKTLSTTPKLPQFP
jgi:hypothetical protein